MPNKIVKERAKGQVWQSDSATSWRHQTVVVWGTLSVGNVCTHCSSLWIYWKALHCSVMENTRRKHILQLYRQLYKHNENVLCQGLLILFFIHLQRAESGGEEAKFTSNAMCEGVCVCVYRSTCTCVCVLEDARSQPWVSFFRFYLLCFLTQDFLVLPGICQFGRLAGQWAPGLILPQTSRF